MNLTAVKDQPPGVIIGANLMVIDGKSVDVNWREAVILNHLISNLGAPVRRSRVMELLYGDDEDGGPGDHHVNNMIATIRGKLRLHDLPLEIKTHNGVGWSMRRTN